MHLAISSSSHEDPATVPPVLVVDDLAEQRAATAALLANQGYPALTERDGDAVLRRVRTQPVRLVVSELYVPCSEGRCTVTCLKQDRGRLPQLRVLVHTRHTTEADVAWALDAGCDGIVPKTASPDVLLREVRRLDALARPHARETPHWHAAPQTEPTDRSKLQTDTGRGPAAADAGKRDS